MKTHYQESKNFFNKVAFEKGGYFTNPKSIPYLVQKKIKEKALDWVKNYQPKRILDAGCGRGNFSMALVKYFPGAEIKGMDFSEEMINLAKSSYCNIENLKFSQADLLSLPFEDKSFDFTFCLDTLHHIHRNDFEKVISEISRVTKNIIIIEFKNKKTIFWPFYKLLFKKTNPGISCYGTDSKEISVLFNKNGFSEEKNFPIFKYKILSPNILEKFIEGRK